MNSKGKIFFQNKWIDVQDGLGPLVNRGYLFGESIFTTARVSQGKIFFLDDHVQRLKDSILFLYGNEIDFDELKKNITEALSKEINNEDYYLRINYLRDLFNNGEFFLFIVPFLQDDRRLRATKAISVRGKSITPEFLKTGNYLETNIELQSAAKNNFDEVLFFNGNNQLLEASTSNVFLVKDGIIKTPLLQNGVLAGIARKHLIHFLNENDFTIEESLLCENDVLEAQEIWLTNSLRFMRCLESYGGRELEDGLYNQVNTQFLKFIGL